MPIVERFIASSGAEVSVWRIEENFQFFKKQLQEVVLPNYKREEHLLEFLAVRVLFKGLGFNHQALIHHGNGHPVYPGKFVSLTHCFPLVAVIVSSQPVGIDIQKPVQKLERIKSRYMNDLEMEFSDQNPDLPLWLWSAKEAIYKKYPLRHLAFREQIRLQKININTLLFSVDKDDFEETVAVRVIEGQVLAFA